MSNRNDLIISIQDKVTDLNISTLIFSICVVAFFFTLALALIMRKELKKSLSNGAFTPESKAPKRFRMLFFGFLGVSGLSLIFSGYQLFTIQGLKQALAEEQVSLENAVYMEQQEVINREQVKPITADEITMIQQQVEDDLKAFHNRLFDQAQKNFEAQKALDSNTNTTVEAEFDKLLREYQGPVVTDRTIPEQPTHNELKKQADQDVSQLIQAVLQEPIRQIEESKTEN